MDSSKNFSLSGIVEINETLKYEVWLKTLKERKKEWNKLFYPKVIDEANAKKW